MSILLVSLGIGCREAPPPSRGTPPAPSIVPAPSLPAPPWFQGEWQGGTRAESAPSTPPVVMQLTIDGAGLVAGTSSLGVAVRGAVDEEVVRLEAEGPGGHGVAVLRRRADTLHGILHYAARGADRGQGLPLTLEHRKAP